MLKTLLAAAFAAAMIATPLTPADAAPEKKLTPQQQKMKDCGAKWQEYKKEKKVKGRAEYRKFQSNCLKS
jgi:Ni/Co efflux regulator RcnB